MITDKQRTAMQHHATLNGIGTCTTALLDALIQLFTTLEEPTNDHHDD